MKDTVEQREKWVRQPPDVRMRQILDAAAQLISDRGYDRMTMAEVAETAGVAKGTVYLYFDSKQAVLTGLQADMFDRMIDVPREMAQRSDLSWAEKLDQLVAHLIEIETEHVRLYHVLFHEIGVAGEEPIEQTRDVLVELLSDGVTAGEFDIDNVEYTASFLLYGHFGTCWHLPEGDPEAVAAATRSLQALFRRTVGAPRQTAS